MERHERFLESARLVVQKQHATASLIHRKLKVHYWEGGKIMDELEKSGIIGKFKGQKSREVLIKDLQSLNKYLNNEPTK